MKLLYRFFLVQLIVSFPAGSLHAGSDPGSPGNVSPLRLPLHFIANAGQWDADTLLSGRLSDQTL